MGNSKDRTILVAVAVVVISGLLFSIVMLIAVFRKSDGLALGRLGGCVAQVDVKGVIIDSEDVVRQLKKYQNDSSVKGLVLRIDSPGGGVAASQEIYDQLLKFRDEGKAIVASMGSVAASGGYYVACAADTIVANPGTITGSIGVVLSYPVVNELMAKVGMRMEVVKSGDEKDVGNYAREVTAEDRKMLQALIDDTHEQFISVVADSRGLDLTEVRELSDGSIYSGQQALQLGLIDRLGTLQDAISLLGEMVDLGDDPSIVKERPIKRPFWMAMKSILGLDMDLILDSLKTWPTVEYIYGL